MDWLSLETPQELLKWMNRIQYGYITDTGERVIGIDDDEDFFNKHYRLQTPSQLAKSKLGVCWDQVELEREWFTKHGYDILTFYMELSDKDDSPSHTFLVYKDEKGGKFKWFEHSWGVNRGIHSYTSVAELYAEISKLQHKMYPDIDGKVFITTYKKPGPNVKTPKQFYKHCYDGTEVFTEAVMI